MQRIHDHLLLEEEYVENQERLRKAKAVKEGNAPAANAGDAEDRNADERSRVDDMRGSPMGVGNLEELIDDDHAIVSSATGPEYYVSIMSFVDKDLLEPGASILLHHKSVSVVGVLTDDADPLVSVMKLDKAPTESYADIGGLETTDPGGTRGRRAASPASGAIRGDGYQATEGCYPLRCSRYRKDAIWPRLWRTRPAQLSCVSSAVS